VCGLIGAFAKAGREVRAPDIAAAVDSMAPRGPDARGLWEEPGVALGHRRLAILDLDERSHQPMISACGRYAIVFNGEIYNFRDLRAQLEREGISFRTTSDTEVLLELFRRCGADMLSRLRGMFAFAIWDRIARKGFAARDPYGIKPLYYAATAEGVLLASQVKALLATGKVGRTADPDGQAGFWLLGSVPEPYTWFREVRALPAGHCAWIEDGVMSTPRCWWDIGAAWRDATHDVGRIDAFEHARESLRRSVRAHMVADVPVGVFLSGGIDSGALAGLMAEAGGAELQAVTIGFREFSGRAQDEVPVAGQIAAHYKIRHHVRVVTREEFSADLPRIMRAMDQPSVDGINTWYASKAVAELGLKVIVSGVGGDELFQGYSSFRTLPHLVRLWKTLSRAPGAMALARAVAELQVKRTGNARWRDAPPYSRSLPGAWWMKRSLHSAAELPRLMPAELVAALRAPAPDEWIDRMSGPLSEDYRLALAQIESTTYLRNQLLRDSDWASMDHSVELRTPLVDAWLLRDLQPLLGSMQRYPNKALLAQAPIPPLPAVVAERSKTGFGIPMSRWLAGDDASLSGGFGSRAWSRRLASTYEACSAR
jgi:asparagine synthase (glutamine-hydrolysing)